MRIEIILGSTDGRGISPLSKELKTTIGWVKRWRNRWELSYDRLNAFESGPDGGISDLFIEAQKLEEWTVRFKSWRDFVLDSYNERLDEMLSAIDILAFNNMEERLYK